MFDRKYLTSLFSQNHIWNLLISKGKIQDNIFSRAINAPFSCFLFNGQSYFTRVIEIWYDKIINIELQCWMLLKYSTPGLKAWQGICLVLGNFRAHPSCSTIMEVSLFFRDKYRCIVIIKWDVINWLKEELLKPEELDRLNVMTNKSSSENFS